MLAIDLVSDLIPLVSVNDSVEQVLNWMDLYRVTHLPVSDGNQYLGLLAESDLLNFPDPNIPVGKSDLVFQDLYVIDNQHIYQVVEQISSQRLSLIPVLSTAREYKGCITLPDLIRGIDRVTGAGQPGAILLIKMPDRDYSLTAISRIIEENNAKVLSSYAALATESREISLTVKISSTEAAAIIRSLERFDYTVRTCFLDDSQLDEFYRSRYEEFMKFMDI